LPIVLPAAVVPSPDRPASEQATPGRRHRRARGFLLAAAFALVLTACTTNSGPKDYNALVEKNFTESCTNANQEKKDVPDATQFCGCVYTAMKSSFAFEEFKTLDTKLRDALEDDKTAPKNADDISRIDARYAGVVNGCRTSGPAAPSSNSTTVVTTTTAKS
jgi:hypothetical protein